LDITGLAGHADLVLDLVIVGFELLQAKRPILYGGAFRYSR
jgi:hypothetical protein